MLKFSFHTVHSDYCNYLREFDPLVPYTMDNNLLANQLSWCNSNKNTIIKQAEKLYFMITKSKTREALVNRCCDFTLDEERCVLYFCK